MTKKQKTLRVIVNSVLLVAIVALGVTVYQSGKKKSEQQNLARLEQLQEIQEESNGEGTDVAEAKPEEETLDVGTAEVEAENFGDITAQAEEDTALSEEIAQIEEDLAMEEAVDEAAASLPTVNFTEDTLMIWPLAGDVLLDYSMNQTIYHPTLDQYKYSSAIAISAPEDSTVLSACPGIVSSIYDDAETGTTVAVDLGNGYQAVYGQLKDVLVYEGQTIGESDIIGYVAAPTKYYSIEGSNLYFAMSKDGEPVDPIAYLP